MENKNLFFTILLMESLMWFFSLEMEMCGMHQNQLAELFYTSKQNISLHIINVFKDKELDEYSVVKDYLTTASDGKNIIYSEI